MNIDTETLDQISVDRLSKDLANAAKILTEDEAKYLVDSYYQCQENRIRSSGQLRAASASGEPAQIFNWLEDQNFVLENQIKRALTKYIENHPIGPWLLNIDGIGPVLAAGLVAHIDITQCPTAGHIWSFAGIYPGQKWQKGAKRPWNPKLKTLLWKCGESFVKVSGKETALYGQIYKERKEEETKKNFQGKFINQAVQALEEKNYDKTTDAWAWYSGCFKPVEVEAMFKVTAPENRQGKLKGLKGEPASGIPMLPPAHLHARAKRHAVTIFTSHLWEIWRKKEGLDIPRPFAFGVLQHDESHYIPPPAWPNE